MPVRQIIEIDEELCDGCGLCATACAEGAIEIIDGKARLVSEVYCDGLGACIGHCPQDALTIVERDSEAFDEAAVEERLARLAPKDAPAPSAPVLHPMHAASGGCPGSRAAVFAPPMPTGPAVTRERPSQLRHWPVQLHLVPPTAPFFADADVLLAADCVAYAIGGFHERFLSGRSLAIACPKLDSNQEIYLDKLVAMIDQASIRSLTVMIMQVPCCGGLRRLAELAARRARRSVPIRCIVVGVRGEILADEELTPVQPAAAAGTTRY